MTPPRPRKAAVTPTPEELAEQGNAIWLEQQKRLAEPVGAVEDGDDLDALYAEVARKPYRFKWVGRWWVLPHLAELDYRVQAEIEAVSDLTLEQVDSLFRKLFGPQQADAWADATQPGPFLSILFDRWLKHSGAQQGEEQASTGSSPSTGRPSKRTSTGSTGSASRRRSTAKKATPAEVVSLPVSS